MTSFHKSKEKNTSSFNMTLYIECIFTPYIVPIYSYSETATLSQEISLILLGFSHSFYSF